MVVEKLKSYNVRHKDNLFPDCLISTYHTMSKIVKIKLNIISQKQSSGKKLNTLTIDELKKVVPYEEDDTIPANEQKAQKISIKPKIAAGTKIKINVKKTETYSNDIDFDPDDSDDEYHPIEPKVIVHPPQVKQTVVKINIKKKTNTVAPHTYHSLILDQKPIKKPFTEKPILPKNLDLETFYDDGHAYLINWQTGYIFLPNEIKENFGEEPEPVGKLTDTPFSQDDFKEDVYPLMKRKIEWFLYYELDIDSIN
jgi:hypothetical protein